jgi:hypothetical protein
VNKLRVENLNGTPEIESESLLAFSFGSFGEIGTVVKFAFEQLYSYDCKYEVEEQIDH